LPSRSSSGGCNRNNFRSSLAGLIFIDHSAPAVIRTVGVFTSDRPAMGPLPGQKRRFGLGGLLQRSKRALRQRRQAARMPSEEK
jgi:hypothetical protein